MLAPQAYTTGKTPLEGLGAHLSSPWTTTVWDNDLARPAVTIFPGL